MASRQAGSSAGFSNPRNLEPPTAAWGGGGGDVVGGGGGGEDLLSIEVKNQILICNQVSAPQRNSELNRRTGWKDVYA